MIRIGDSLPIIHFMNAYQFDGLFQLLNSQRNIHVLLFLRRFLGLEIALKL